LTQPLLSQSKTGEQEVSKATKLLGDYDLTREDFDSLMEVGQFQGKVNYMSQVRIIFVRKAMFFHEIFLKYCHFQTLNESCLILFLSHDILALISQKTSVKSFIISLAKYANCLILNIFSF